MKLGKKNVIRKETLLGVGLILCLAIGNNKIFYHILDKSIF